MTYKYLLYMSNEGLVAEYNSVDELAEEFKRNRPNYWSNRTVEFVVHLDQNLPVGSLFDREPRKRAVLYDPWGRVVHPDYVYKKIDEAWNRYCKTRIGRRYRLRTTHKFRDGPVPFTGKRGSYCWLRHPKTLNELRQNDVSEDNLELEDTNLRVKARRVDLPTVWDDIVRKDDQRCWKKTRRTQYKT